MAEQSIKPLENTEAKVQVQKLNQSTETKKGNKLLIIFIAIGGFALLFCCTGLAIIALLLPTSNNTTHSRNETNETSAPTETPTTNVTIEDDRSYANGADKPPLSKRFTEEVLKKTRSLNQKDGYRVNVNALGDPSYTFSLLYKSDWKTSKFTNEDYILRSDDGNVSIGVLYFSSDTRAYQMSCYEIVKGIFSDSNWTGQNAVNVEINGETWSRVSYTVDKGTADEVKGVDQCLKKDEAIILYFFVASAEEWSRNSVEYNKLINDIYVSKIGLNY